MSTKHLTVGSVDPPRTEGLLRVYSMKFCPFAQRALLVLKAKKIPHEVVNINLFKKPEWYSKINEKTLVPALLDGDKVITESLDIANYLDDKYPENPLHSSDPTEKQKVKDIIDKSGPATQLFLACILKDEQKTPEEWAKLFIEVLQPLEDELAKSGTPFFGGEVPGMADYMIWPWAERSSCIAIKLGQKLPFSDNDIPLLKKWRKNMLNNPVCAELYISGDRFWKIVQCKATGTPPPYDEV